jgi:hypothetical protein
MTPTTFHDAGLAWIAAVLPVLLTLIAAGGSVYAAIRSAAHGQAIKDISERQDRQGAALNAVTSTSPASTSPTLASSAAAPPSLDVLALLSTFAGALHTTQDKTAQATQQAANAALATTMNSTLEMNQKALLDGISALAAPAEAAPVQDAPAGPPEPPPNPPGLLAKVTSAVTNLLPGSKGPEATDQAPATGATGEAVPEALPASVPAPAPVVDGGTFSQE